MLIEESKAVENQLPNKAQPPLSQVLKELRTTTMEQRYKATHKDHFPQCLHSVQFSSFNPVPPARRLQGDLFYLTVRTLDVGERGITCCSNGFYVNGSVEGSSFNPGPRKPQVMSYTLAGCLNQLSPLFAKNLQKYLKDVL